MRRLAIGVTALWTLGCASPALEGDWQGDCDVTIDDFAFTLTGLAAVDGATVNDATGTWNVYSGAGTVEGEAGSLTAIECTADGGCTNAEDHYDTDAYLIEVQLTADKLELQGTVDDDGNLGGACFFSDDGLVYTGAFHAEPAS